MLKAIETRYKGYRFRSRLEARWAVFFDTLGLRWEYEPEGFDLGAHGRYLPDFRVAGERASVWVEIKPFDSHSSDTKIRALAEASGYDCVLCVGEPSLHPIRSFEILDPKEGVQEGTGVFASDKYSPFYFGIGGSGPKGRILSHDWVDFEDLKEAVRRAKAVRFEHGENGTIS